METTCLQCGDRGFANAFVYCVKCLNVAVHRYCLDVIPKAVDEFVRWICDDCEVEVRNQPAVCKHDAVQCQTIDRTASKRIIGYSAVNTEKPVYAGGLRQSYDACEKLDSVECAESACECCAMGLRGMNDELVILSAENERKRCKQRQSSSQQLGEESMKKKRSAITVATIERGRHRLDNNSSRRPHKEYANIDISDCVKLVKESKASERRDHRLFSQLLHESDPGPGTIERPFLSDNGSLRNSKKKTVAPLGANLEDQGHGTVFAQHHLRENKWFDLDNQSSDMSTEVRGVKRSNDHNENRKSEVSKERTSAPHHINNFCKEFLKDSNILSMVDHDTCPKPVSTPVWRGSFNIWNKNGDTLDGLMAHMSSNACQKAYEEACQFQPTVHLKILPKSDVWPKSFKTSSPSGENIALYFFPSEIRSERLFDHLVDEMVHKELALRAILQNAELLVFTSTELTLECWRFQGKYYLWGVFRAKQHSTLRGRSRDGPVILEDLPNDSGFNGARSPASPLSNVCSYGSGSS